ncbi:MAG: MFS family permease [Glaciecola sp.]|uniref:MFS transporter n=1 Tax=Congregibacter sp. TaxID=2744308 RepID=UPI0039E49E4E
MSDVATETPSTKNYPAAGVAWYSISVLLIVYTIAFVDRTILALLVGPIQRDLGISDTLMGLLHGIAFALFYAALGIPIARLSDQHSRRWIILVGMVVWSAMTAACGVARNFWQLFIARIGVGVGEAALSPAAYSMIADIFPPHRLGRALSIYSSGVFFGAGIAFMLGGAIIGALEAVQTIVLPVVGEIRSWQAVFFMVGIPGALFALLMLTVPEPARKSLIPTTTRMALPGLWSYIKANRRVVGGHFLGFSLLAVVFNGYIAWAPTQLIRDFSVSAGEAGRALGAVIFLFGGSGIVVGGIVADRLSKHGYSDANMRTGVIAAVGLLPACVLAPQMSSFGGSIAAYAAFFFFSSFPYGAAAAALQVMAPHDLRARLSAIYLLVLNLIGIGLGPLTIAAVSDHFLGGKAYLGTAMSIVSAVVVPVGALILLLTLPAFRRLVKGS